MILALPDVHREPSRRREGFSFTGPDDTVAPMTPEEELSRLNRVIHQYESVYRTTLDTEQRRRVEKQLKELKSYREKILAVNVINPDPVEEREETSSSLVEFPILQRLIEREAELLPRQRLSPLWAKDAPATGAQEEIFNLMLYARWFREEFLPFLTQKRMKLDFKYSLDRDGFYARFQEVERKLDHFREENARITEGAVGRELELEMRKRIMKLKRQVEIDAARLFHAVRVFAADLGEDAEADGVKCLNGAERVAFDPFEGHRALEGRTVREALSELSRLASEAEAYLNVPDIERQENESADRY